ncbi:MAG: hypothetical protein AAF668_04785 [Pseudomonadota bacterium]
MLSEQPSSFFDDEIDAVEETNRDGLKVELFIEDPDILEALNALSPGKQRRSFIEAALKIGVTAMRQAQGRIDADRVRDEGERLMGDLTNALGTYRQGVSEDIQRTLKEYFDPSSGRFSERVERLVRKDGELEAVMKAQVEGDGSVLMRTLASHLGPESPIMTAMDPTAENGLAKRLASSVERTALEQRTEILKQFSLDNPEGALSRTLRELASVHGEAGQALEKKLSDAVAEFSLDKEDSALSRLVRRVDAAQRTMTDELSLDKHNSALARIRKEMLDQIEALSQKNNEFQTDVVERLAAMAARKSEAQRSTTHGNDFEAALFEVVQDTAQKAGDIATATGAKPGLIKQCKVGDFVVEVGPEHASAGTKVVIEAKQSASYDLLKARDEIKTARQNRDAAVGVFVFSRRTAPAGLDPFSRIGEDLFVIWDEEDEMSDLYVTSALSVAKALCVAERKSEKAVEVDLETMERSVRSVEKQIKGLIEIDGWAKNVVRDGGKIEDRVRRMAASIERDVGNLDEGLRILKSGT